MNFTLCKNRCNYTKRNKQSRNPPLSVQPFQTRTIPRPAPSPLPYERSVGFASLQSPWAFNFGHPCPSLVKGEVLSPEKIRATTGGIATSLLPKPHYPSPCTTTLASLVKGRWLDGKAQTVALLRPACDMSVLFILQTFLPSRRRDCLSCIDPLHPHNHCKKTIVPCSAPHSCHMNALLVSHPCETLGVQLRASMPVPCQR